MPTSRNSGLGTPNFPHAVDVLFHPSSRTPAGACPLQPPTAAQMDSAGVRQALVSQCKRWSCERQWMCVDTRLEDVLRYTASSSRFVGLAGYNPFDIPESLREIELAVATHHFRGVYLHAASFRLPLTDAHIYPLFAKAAELAVPALIELPVTLGHSALENIVADFPELALVLSQSSPQIDELAAIAADCENAYFALDVSALAQLKQSWSALAAGHDGQQERTWPATTAGRGQEDLDLFSGILSDRCMWGSNGMDWTSALRAADGLSISPPPALPDGEGPSGDFAVWRENFLFRNAERVFALAQPPASRVPRSVVTEVVAAER